MDLAHSCAEAEVPPLAGNALRPSRAENDEQPINDLPGLCPTEDWVVHCWGVVPYGHLHALVHSPRRTGPLVSAGAVSASFDRLRQEDSGLYHRALTWLEGCFRVMDD